MEVVVKSVFSGTVQQWTRRAGGRRKWKMRERGEHAGAQGGARGRERTEPRAGTRASAAPQPHANKTLVSNLLPCGRQPRARLPPVRRSLHTAIRPNAAATLVRLSMTLSYD